VTFDMTCHVTCDVTCCVTRDMTLVQEEDEAQALKDKAAQIKNALAAGATQTSNLKPQPPNPNPQTPNHNTFSGAIAGAQKLAHMADQTKSQLQVCLPLKLQP